MLKAYYIKSYSSLMNHARVQINTHQSKWAQQFSNFNPLEKVHAGGGHVCFGFISARHIAEIQNVFGDQWLWPQVGLCKNKTASRLPSSTSVVLSSSRHYVTLCSEAELNWMEYSRCIWALSCFPMVFDSDIILLFFFFQILVSLSYSRLTWNLFWMTLNSDRPAPTPEC